MKKIIMFESLALLLLILISSLLNFNCGGNTKGVAPMSEIIDLLMHKGGEAATFTVDTAVDFVALSLGASGLLTNGDGDSRFTLKDHFQILSFGCTLPLGFEFYDNDLGGVYFPPRVNMQTQLVGGGLIQQIIPDNPWLPFANYEMNLGNYNNLGANYIADFEMLANFTVTYDQRISMIGVSDDLHAKVFRCPIFVKILHTITLE